jgi:hypothetical protein
MCFDAACQRAVDAAFVAAIGGPLVAATALGVWFYLLRAPPKDALESGKVFEDADTGTLFEGPEGVVPELDKNVRLCCVCWAGCVQVLSVRACVRLISSHGRGSPTCFPSFL